MTLEDYLAMDNLEEIREVTFPRIKLTFKLRSLTSEEATEVAKEVVRERRNNPRMTEEDLQAGTTLRLVVTSIIEPNLIDERLLKKLGATTPDQVLMRMLRPGEYTKLLNVHNEINGEYKEIKEEMIEEAKN